jgi:hypothetical protein
MGQLEVILDEKYMQIYDKSLFYASCFDHFDRMSPFECIAYRPLPRTHQRTPFQVQIGQSNQRKDPPDILHNPLITHREVAKLTPHPIACQGHFVVTTLFFVCQSAIVVHFQHRASEYSTILHRALEGVIDVTNSANPIKNSHKAIVAAIRLSSFWKTSVANYNELTIRPREFNMTIYPEIL